MTHHAFRLTMDLIQGHAGDGVVERFRFPSFDVAVRATVVQFPQITPLDVAIQAVQAVMVDLQGPSAGGVIEHIVRIPPMAMLTRVVFMANKTMIVHSLRSQIAHGLQLGGVLVMTRFTPLLLVAITAVAVVLIRVRFVMKGHLVVFFVIRIVNNQIPHSDWWVMLGFGGGDRRAVERTAGFLLVADHAVGVPVPLGVAADALPVIRPFKARLGDVLVNDIHGMTAFTRSGNGTLFVIMMAHLAPFDRAGHVGVRRVVEAYRDV